MPETFVLIPGAWHGGWAWRAVAEHLRAGGHRVLTLTLPGLSDGEDPVGLQLSNAVDHVVGALEAYNLTKVTLVAHSWGGYPLTGAASRLSARLRRMVFCSAFVPAEGRSLMDEVPPHYVELFTQLAEASGNNTVAMPFEVWQQAFMQDASEETQRVAHELLVRQPMTYFTGTVDVAAFAALDVPASYVITTDDIALPPGEFGWTPRFPERLDSPPVIEAPGSHEACFTRPRELAEAIVRA